MKKRLFDLLVSFVLLIILSPLFLMVSIALRISLGSPILFIQERPGLHGIPFFLYKFRTMGNQVNENGILLPENQRRHPLGNLLRKLSLDELPQLINVVKGEMSLVGPRPLLIKYLSRYTSEQFRRHEVKPGITGWAQVNGRNAITWEQKFELDVWYVNHRTFRLDLFILGLTVLKVFKGAGVNHMSNISMPEFFGIDKGEKNEPF